MLNFSIFIENKINPDDELLFLGIKTKYFSLDAAKNYVCWKIENELTLNEVDAFILTCDDAESVIEMYVKAGVSPTETTKRVLRYLVLRSLKSTEKQLLYDIESIYADFDYPKDMESFIYYMPSQSSKEGVKTENSVQTLINRFHQFLDSEADYIRTL